MQAGLDRRRMTDEEDKGTPGLASECKQDERAVDGASESKSSTTLAAPLAPLTEMVPPQAAPFELDGAVPIECPAGTLVILHGAVVHYSERNTSTS